MNAVKMQNEAVISHLRILNDATVLNVESTHLFEVAVVGAVGGDELRHDRHLLRRVDGELRPGSVKLTENI